MRRPVRIDGLFQARDLPTDIARYARLAAVHDRLNEVFDERQVKIRRGRMPLDALVVRPAGS